MKKDQVGMTYIFLQMKYIVGYATWKTRQCNLYICDNLTGEKMVFRIRTSNKIDIYEFRFLTNTPSRSLVYTLQLKIYKIYK